MCYATERVRERGGDWESEREGKIYSIECISVSCTWSRQPNVKSSQPGSLGLADFSYNNAFYNTILVL